VALAGCRQDMQNQPRLETFEAGAARPLVAGTVAQGQFPADELFTTGRVNGRLSEVFPIPVTRELLLRGQNRFNIYCSPCHGRTGEGNGPIVERGLRQPPSYHIERLRAAPVGHFFDVITNGFGAMYDYADRVAPYDRWAVIAYIRALQLSQNAGAGEAPEAERQRLGGAQ
jgi:mono/diheme cytochrome c family protein